jgi:hypothetical protein
MILESLGRQRVKDLEIIKRDLPSSSECTDLYIFSPGVLRQFLVENDMLKTLTFEFLSMNEEVSYILGRFSRDLDSLEIGYGVLKIQQFANGVEANEYRPHTIILQDIYN